MEPRYNFNLVILSVVVAILASYVALELATAVTHAKKGKAKGFWLAGGGIAMGFGIWSMHFIGMLAFEMPGMSMAYDVNLMLLSIVVAVTASALALFIVSRPVVTAKSVVAGGLAMAMAISGMHYIGMFSMRMAAEIRWNIPLVVLSVFIALIASYLALSVSIRIRDNPHHQTQRVLASFLMGAAISGMHYTGMSAANFVHASMPSTDGSDLLASDALTIIIIVMTVFILGLALVGAALERVIARKTKRLEESTQLYREARKVAADLRKEREIRERFVSALAHDLRTPLAASIMGAQLCVDEASDPSAVQMLASKVIESLQHMDQMIEELLDANRISAGQKLSLSPEKFNVAEFLVKVLENLKTVHGDRFILKCEENLEAEWDKKYIRRAVENLCTNAVKYGKKDAPITIGVKSAPANHSFVKVSVHNEGKALTAEEIKHLFGLFNRGQDAETNSQKGWGIGLTIVRGVVEAHGGNVQVESSIETGTAFLVEIPRTPTALQGGSESPGRGSEAFLQ